MITHNTNINHLFDVDNTVYPQIQYRFTKLLDTDRVFYNYYHMASKVTVKGRNGEKYYVPVVELYKDNAGEPHGDETFFLKQFREKCKIVRDHYITTEGLDVLATDYNKIKKYGIEKISDTRTII